MNATAIYDVASLVLDCICDQMDGVDEQDYPGCPCLAYVSAGEPAIDCCTVDCEDGGMLTVHIESVFPSDVFPEASPGFEPCKASTWVAQIVVTAARCARQTDDEGDLVPAEELSASALLMGIDQYAILTALSCCVGASPPAAKRLRRVKIGESTPLVAEGGCASVEVRALVEVGPVCSCVSGS